MKIISDVIEYYKTTEEYLRKEVFDMEHNEIILTPDYPYYAHGLRGIKRTYEDKSLKKYYYILYVGIEFLMYSTYSSFTRDASMLDDYLMDKDTIEKIVVCDVSNYDMEETYYFMNRLYFSNECGYKSLNIVLHHSVDSPEFSLYNWKSLSDSGIKFDYDYELYPYMDIVFEDNYISSEMCIKSIRDRLNTEPIFVEESVEQLYTFMEMMYKNGTIERYYMKYKIIISYLENNEEDKVKFLSYLLKKIDSCADNKFLKFICNHIIFEIHSLISKEISIYDALIDKGLNLNVLEEDYYEFDD